MVRKTDSLQYVFAQDNILIDDLPQGTMLYFRRGNESTRKGSNHKAHVMRHATMYAGKGNKESNTFIPSEDGKHMYAGYNNASILPIFGGYWGTNDVITINMNKIASVNYEKQATKIAQMSRRDLEEFIGDTSGRLYTMNHVDLVETALNKYYGKDIPDTMATPEEAWYVSNPLGFQLPQQQNIAEIRVLGQKRHSQNDTLLTQYHNKEAIIRKMQRSGKTEKSRA